MSDALRLRAHQVLCLQGFRGLGYSPEFVEALTAVHERLASNLEQEVELLTEPDVLCAACPHLRGGVACTLGGPSHEEHMRRQDEAVLERLDLDPGAHATWETIRERIRVSIQPADLAAICTTCPWLPLGYCEQGLYDLNA